MGRRFYNRDELMGDGLMRFITWELGNARRVRGRWDWEGFDGCEVGDGRGLIGRVDEIRMVAIGQCKRSDGCGRWICFGFPCKIPWGWLCWTRRSKGIGVMHCINKIGWRIWEVVWRRLGWWVGTRDVATSIILEG